MVETKKRKNVDLSSYSTPCCCDVPGGVFHRRFDDADWPAPEEEEQSAAEGAVGAAGQSALDVAAAEGSVLVINTLTPTDGSFFFLPTKGTKLQHANSEH
ncbi:hypothetical protein TYRP_013867 [Tyrophagus putrescentiae]|nr:hypothetical protein TYRP_013867 [Tyrophagus putrescentiae]